MCVHIHIYVTYVYIHVTWHIYTWNTTHLRVWHYSFIRVQIRFALTHIRAVYRYGVATISRLLTIIGLFFKRALWLYSAKETCDFEEPTNHSHPIHNHMCRRTDTHVYLYACTRRSLLQKNPIKGTTFCKYMYSALVGLSSQFATHCTVQHAT